MARKILCIGIGTPQIPVYSTALAWLLCRRVSERVNRSVRCKSQSTMLFFFSRLLFAVFLSTFWESIVVVSSVPSLVFTQNSQKPKLLVYVRFAWTMKLHFPSDTSVFLVNLNWAWPVPACLLIAARIIGNSTEKCDRHKTYLPQNVEMKRISSTSRFNSKRLNKLHCCST